jgi:glycosyltransferase involved in cell wall biosynthesis
VVVPVLDAEQFLAEAVESVLDQSYTSWELLLVDDGSTDGSDELARGYAARDPRVRCLKRDGTGNKAAARNLGIRHARGTYLAFLDADDVWPAGTLEQRVSILVEHPEAAAAYGQWQDWYGWTGRPADAARDRLVPLGLRGNMLMQPPELLRLALETKIPTAAPSTLVLRREVLDRRGGFEEAFDARNAAFEDQVFLTKVYLSEPVYVVAECWARYRQHPDSRVAVAVRTGQKVAAGQAFCEWVHAYLIQRGVEDEALWRALAMKRWRYHHPTLDRWRQRLHAVARWLRHHAGQLVRRLRSLVAGLARRVARIGPGS